MKRRDLIIFLVILVLGILFFVVTNYKNLTIKDDSVPSEDVSAYKCPKTEYIDCMPTVGSNPSSTIQKMCEDQDYLDWAQKNCPGFKGVAY